MVYLLDSAQIRRQHSIGNPADMTVLGVIHLLCKQYGQNAGN